MKTAPCRGDKLPLEPLTHSPAPTQVRCQPPLHLTVPSHLRLVLYFYYKHTKPGFFFLVRMASIISGQKVTFKTILYERS